jgi:hypothetical protein
LLRWVDRRTRCVGYVRSSIQGEGLGLAVQERRSRPGQQRGHRLVAIYRHEQLLDDPEKREAASLCPN